MAIDIGNTSISLGLFEDKSLSMTFAISSSEAVFSYRKILQAQLDKNKICSRDIEAVIFCSVVPKLTDVFSKNIKKMFSAPLFIIGRNITAPIKNNYKKPSQVGYDRLVDAVAARELYGVPAVIVDSGTAITFDFISKKGEYEGGLIVPGIDISLKGLYEKTALLPQVKLKDDKGLTLIGKDTAGSIKSGFLNGFGSLTDGIIAKIKSKHAKKAMVIGTGGYIEFIKKYSKSIDKIDKFLTLKGLNIIYSKYS